ncbi:MAG: Gfo/Idh/MocA family oxidoreductase [Natrialbaceae archaeon]|nr:Gfo/Idh/MocA family oxidoreductase [Natrialbaceae archaeon]
MTKRYKVGVVGCGSIAKERHIPALKANPRISLSTVYDHHWPNAEKTAEDYNIQNIYDDYELFLASDLDLVTISTPPFTHAEYTVKALKTETNVFCEKPMAVELEDAKSMISAAERSSAELGIVHNFLLLTIRPKSYAARTRRKVWRHSVRKRDPIQQSAP